jgi:hypothetical protein
MGPFVGHQVVDQRCSLYECTCFVAKLGSSGGCTQECFGCLNCETEGHVGIQ